METTLLTVSLDANNTLLLTLLLYDKNYSSVSGTYSLPDIERDLATGVTDGKLQKFCFKTECLSPLLFASCKKYVENVFLRKYVLSGSTLQTL